MTGEKTIIEPYRQGIHPARKVAALIYQTDIDMSRLLFDADYETALGQIQALMHGEPNAFGAQNIKVAVAAGTAEPVLGMYITFSKKNQDRFQEYRTFTGTMDLWGKLKFTLVAVPVIQFFVNSALQMSDLYLSNISVAPESQGKGVGKIMLAEAINDAKGAGFERLVLDVAKNNGRAIGLYLQNGFEKIGQKGLDIGRYKVGVYRLAYKL